MYLIETGSGHYKIQGIVDNQHAAWEFLGPSLKKLSKGSVTYIAALYVIGEILGSTSSWSTALPINEGEQITLAADLTVRWTNRSGVMVPLPLSGQQFEQVWGYTLTEFRAVARGAAEAYIQLFEADNDWDALTLISQAKYIVECGGVYSMAWFDYARAHSRERNKFLKETNTKRQTP